MPGARLASQQSLWIIRLEVMMLISIACTINSLKRKKNIVTDALYRSICFCPLEKGFSHKDRKWLLWFIHKLSSWYVSTSRSIQLSPLSAEQRQHDISVVKASACQCSCTTAGLQKNNCKSYTRANGAEPASKVFAYLHQASSLLQLHK